MSSIWFLPMILAAIAGLAGWLIDFPYGACAAFAGITFIGSLAAVR